MHAPANLLNRKDKLLSNERRIRLAPSDVEASSSALRKQKRSRHHCVRCIV